MSVARKKELERNLLMIYTGDTRSANSILAQQNVAISGGGKFENQKRMVKLAFDLKKTLEENDIDDFGRFLHEGWLLKKTLTKAISTSWVDDIYESGIKAGALGGKLLGAGGGGFILFYCPLEKQENFRKQMSRIQRWTFNSIITVVKSFI